ncbi:valyl-tRNA synthetase [Limnothrix sp. PR1529]|uniref:valine--tRNA ligase n=1 Tax=Limnothrix sp. PR1529 TaxID=1704291 RepID=UPI00081E9A7D|nr:valine--tRNA ligase [Limnothrix sp. P13C2]PIB14511.1 valyl-tRNA synthetase [Limnothrix sp. PR1529]
MTAPVDALPTQYDPKAAEAKWQSTWEDSAAFAADVDAAGEPFCVVIPPPNVTGSLHMGHAFEHSLIDAFVRYHRMTGRNTLWLPGTDHASIAVQSILDKQLKDEGTDRFALGREAFLDRAWTWKEESGGTIVGQMRRLGLSVDWDRERFTMDEGLSNAVLEAFVRLYEDGLIYRGKYMVNWCPASQSAVSDLEVDNKEVDGSLWHFRYPLTDGSGEVVVATTRPETMLGDTAVAVNPKDDRYKALIGQTVTLPLVGREIPIIGDEFVDPTFGTGCVKVTPAHDPNDFEMGKRHNLPQIEILNKDGTVNENGGEFCGQDRFVARKNLVAKMEELGYLEKVEAYRHSVPYSERGKVPVEPLLSSQWFLQVRPLAEKALADLENNREPLFVPDRWTKVYRDWLLNLRDWCISRQLWWGHQIPAWFVISETNGQVTEHTPFIVARTEADALKQAQARYGEGAVLERDEDVLDTWFSSGLWPFSTLGWPNESAADFQTYYPNTMLVTGFDIIFFWVARMTMMAGYFTGQMPFKTVYVHGLVRDENNQKMSKSKGNGIDPLLLIDKYGTDAVRYTLVREVAGAGQDIRLDYNRKTDESVSVEASRNFANKLWNASRFVLMNLAGETPASLGAPEADRLELADRWILSRFNQTVRQTRHDIDHYGLGEAAKGLYEFIWGDFCDWYIELVKPRLNGDDPAARRTVQQVLALVLDGTLKLLHPFMPHITEEVWHALTGAAATDFLALQAYPVAIEQAIDRELEAQFEAIINAIRTIRNLRAEADIKPGQKVPIVLQPETDRERTAFEIGRAYICNLAKVSDLTIQGGATSVAPTADPEPTLMDADTAALLEAIATDEMNLDADELAWEQSEKRRVALLTLAMIGTAVFALYLAHSTLDAIDEIPLLPSIFQLIGFFWTVYHLPKTLLFARDRAAFANGVRQTKLTYIGEGNPFAVRAYPGETPAAAPTKPQPLQLPAAQAPEVTLPIDLGQAEPEAVPIERAMAGVVGTTQVLLPLVDGVVDLAALRAKLTKALTKAEGEIKGLSGRLSNPGFVDKAPPEVVASARAALAEAETQAQLLRDRLAQLQ